ncbi:hypothetical protein Ancab_040056 [Ancistrocladus abbreviatus]
MDLFPTFFAFMLVLCGVLLWWWLRTYPSNRVPPPPPEPAGSWPIIGHLPLLAGSQLPHIVLSNLADQYGPIFTIKLGVNRAIVVSNKDLAKECLADNDKAFLNRPKTLVVQHMSYNSAMFSFGPYGAYWREMRKIAVLELLSNHRIEMLKQARIHEVKSAIKLLHDKIYAKRSGASGGAAPDGRSQGILVEMKQWFGDLNTNVLLQLVAGKTLREIVKDEERGLRTAISELAYLVGVVAVSDILPFLRWLDIGGHEKAMKRVMKKLDHALQGWLDEHKRERERESMHGKSRNQKDFMDVLLDIFDTGIHESLSSFEPDTVIKATCLGIIGAAIDTSTITLTWTLSLLLNNRRVLKEVQDELDLHVGKNRVVEESDLKNLVYLQATIKETLRLYPATPLSVPHEAMTDCNISGYHVPAGTMLFVNLHKIHRDPQLWSDPIEFRPERYLTTHNNIDLRGRDFEFIPFGSGRRVCPGISFALQIMQFTLANLLHGFDIKTPGDEPVNMTESPGLTMPKALPLDVILTPRLHDHLYEAN